MSIEELHYEIERRWNKNSNNHRKYLTDLEKDQVLNTAINEYVDIFFNARNRNGYDVGFEVNERMIEMLDTLVYSYPEQGLLRPVKVDDSGVYKVDLTKTNKPFRHYISARVVTNCGEMKLNPEQHGDMNTIIGDYHRKANKAFKELPSTRRNNALFLYTDNKFIPTGLKLSYLKKPNRVCIGTYKDITNKDNPNADNKPKVECDLPSDFHDILISITLQELGRIYNNPATVQLENRQ